MSSFCKLSLLKAVCVLGFLMPLTLSPVFSQTLDATFGNGGKVITAINDSSTANAIAIQNDGKIVVGGSTTIGAKDFFTLVRYNTNGSLDNSFGSGGKVITRVGEKGGISSIAIQQDGKIVAGGSAYSYTPFYTGDFTLIRYKTDGSTDSLFGNNGIAKAQMRGLGTIKKILIKSDGKILAGGTLGLGTFENIPALALFNTNGTIDSSFGINGRFQDYVNGDTTLPRMISDMAFASDGKIVATGETGDNRTAFAVFRYLPNGIIDSAFGVRGLVVTGFYNTSSYDAYAESVAIAVLPDNKIVAGGYSYKSQIGTRFSMVRLNTTGSLDSTFGTDGKVMAPGGLANHLFTDPDGNLILTGYTTETGNSDFGIAKYFPNGKSDSTFGTNGIVTTDFTGFHDESYASAIQPDGKVVLAGHAGNNTKYSIALARYTLKVLPLTLISFTAQKDGKHNLLKWTTAQEINADRFEIERSLNGKNYNSIGKVNAGVKEYSFTDDMPSNTINYYRLKMIDRDGKFEYSMVRTISNRGSFYVNIYPLPAAGNLNIRIVSTETIKATISVSNISGKELITRSVSLLAGVNNSSLNVGSLSKGTYFLKVFTSEATETRKIVVNN